MICLSIRLSELHIRRVTSLSKMIQTFCVGFYLCYYLKIIIVDSFSLVFLSTQGTQEKLNMPEHGGNRAYDLWNASL